MPDRIRCYCTEDPLRECLQLQYWVTLTPKQNQECWSFCSECSFAPFRNANHRVSHASALIAEAAYNANAAWGATKTETQSARVDAPMSKATYKSRSTSNGFVPNQSNPKHLLCNAHFPKPVCGRRAANTAQRTVRSAAECIKVTRRAGDHSPEISYADCFIEISP